MADLDKLTEAALFDELTLRTEETRNAERTEDDAHRAATECRNRLNEVQREIDLRIGKLRTAAPRNTDWHSALYKRKGEPA